jgi:hypothetical protein
MAALIRRVGTLCLLVALWVWTREHLAVCIMLTLTAIRFEAEDTLRDIQTKRFRRTL